jgi:hypothetical protein
VRGHAPDTNARKPITEPSGFSGRRRPRNAGHQATSDHTPPLDARPLDKSGGLEVPSSNLGAPTGIKRDRPLCRPESAPKRERKHARHPAAREIKSRPSSSGGKIRNRRSPDRYQPPKPAPGPPPPLSIRWRCCAISDSARLRSCSAWRRSASSSASSRSVVGRPPRFRRARSLRSMSQMILRRPSSGGGAIKIAVLPMGATHFRYRRPARIRRAGRSSPHSPRSRRVRALVCEACLADVDRVELAERGACLRVHVAVEQVARRR